MTGQLPRSTNVVSVGASPVGLTLTRLRPNSCATVADR